MDGKFYRYDTSVKDVIFNFKTENLFSSNYYMPEVYIRPIRFQLILRLDFILTHYHGMILTRNGVTFLKEEIVPINNNTKKACNCKIIEYLEE